MSMPVWRIVSMAASSGTKCVPSPLIASDAAVTAASLAIKGDGTHFVPLDAAIETMRQTGLDMSEKYKETSLGGLAVNVVEC